MQFLSSYKPLISEKILFLLALFEVQKTATLSARSFALSLRSSRKRHSRAVTHFRIRSASSISCVAPADHLRDLMILRLNSHESGLSRNDTKRLANFPTFFCSACVMLHSQGHALARVHCALNHEYSSLPVRLFLVTAPGGSRSSHFPLKILRVSKALFILY